MTGSIESALLIALAIILPLFFVMVSLSAFAG